MVKISLPNPNDYQDNVDGFLRQLELSVHHAQKSWEMIKKDDAENDGEYYITFRHPNMNFYDRESDDNGFVKVHVDDESGKFNDIEIEINAI